MILNLSPHAASAFGVGAIHTGHGKFNTASAGAFASMSIADLNVVYDGIRSAVDGVNAVITQPRAGGPEDIVVDTLDQLMEGLAWWQVSTGSEDSSIVDLQFSLVGGFA